MLRDPHRRMQQVRNILRVMEEAVDLAKQRRTGSDEVEAFIPATPAPPPAAGPTPATPAFPLPPAGPHGRGRDVPGPEGLPRAKAKPKGLGGGYPPTDQASFGRTG
jgi:hypothetical protein